MCVCVCVCVCACVCVCVFECGGGQRRYFVNSAKQFADGIKLVYNMRSLNGARISIHNMKGKITPEV